MFKIMTCARVEKFLPLYTAGDLACGRRGRAVEKHLAACPQCRRIALEYQESRELFRAAALSPNFDGAFYEELRSSVLARIRRDRTLAPPSAFPKLFGARLAYAASLVLLVIAAALAFSAYMRRTSEDGARPHVLAGAKRVQPPTPMMSESSAAARPRSGDVVQATRPTGESARGTTGAARRAARSSFPKPDANIERAQNESPTRLHLTSRTPAAVARHPHAPTSAAATARSSVVETAAARDGGGEVTTAQPGVSRIEIQTSDPNIRIIWLSPDTKDPAGSLK